MHQARRKITIVEVASAAGVSVKTVSRVINRERHVRAAVTERVEEAIRKLGYVPNLAARSLSGSRSFMIGAFYDNPSPFYLASLQAGAMEACRELGYHLVIERLDLSEPQPPIEDILRTARLDGVILSPPLTDHAQLLANLEERQIPVVRLSPLADPDCSPAIFSNDEDGAYQVAEHLLSVGHKRFAFIAGPETHLATSLRRKGFYAALAKSGIDEESVRSVAGDFSFQSGMDAGIALLREGYATAIFASNDDMAAGVIAAAAQLGVKIPDEVSLAGFDDSPIATLVWPPLTTVRQPIAEMSAVAARMLIESRSDPTECWHADVELVVRGSTARPPD